MPIIPQVGRKSFRMGMVVLCIYVVLICLSITTLYPLSIMLSNSVSSPANEQEYTLFPLYLYDERELFRMYVFDKYANFNRLTHRRKNLEWLNQHYKSSYSSSSDIQLPPLHSVTDGRARRAADFNEFKRSLDKKFWTRGFEYQARKRYVAFLEQRYQDQIHNLNRAHGADYPGFDLVYLPQEEPFDRAWELDTAVSEDYLQFASTLPEEERVVYATDMIFADFLKSRHVTIQSLNEKYNSAYENFTQVRLPLRAPASGMPRRDWESFVRERWPYKYLRLTGGDAEFAQFLLGKYGSIEAINTLFKQRWNDMSSIQLPPELPAEKMLAADWKQFMSDQIPIDRIQLDTPEARYTEFLRNKYTAVEALNREYQGTYGSFEEIGLPFVEADVCDFESRNQSGLKWEFLIRNYRDVTNYILLKGHNRGRALVNTFVLVAMTLLGALTINPLCAFALSRFNLRYGYKILIVLLATAAIPGEVTLIPSFLLIKNLGLLNTYWALVLPGLASGFSIFLLKGFFDSLPKELYEAAMIEGASELYMFWKITLPLCKPILALLALGAFASAYGGFMWAFMICPNPELWTLMVFIYDFQRVNSQSVVMASLVIASLPTLLVFLFCQRIILRGIIIPSYK